MSAAAPDRQAPARALVVRAPGSRCETDVVEVLAAGGWSSEVAEVASVSGPANPFGAVDAVVLLLGREREARVARTVRRATHAAIVAVVPAATDVAKVLDAGVDDVVAEDAVARELVARLRTRSHRRAGLVPDRVSLGGLSIDRDERSVRSGDEVVDLTAREYDLLVYLVERAGQIVSREDLLRDVWGSSPEWQQARTVNEHVRRLRNKIGDRWIVTIRGYGYRFDPTPS